MDMLQTGFRYVGITVLIIERERLIMSIGGEKIQGLGTKT